jgi:cell division septation protein DedD
MPKSGKKDGKTKSYGWIWTVFFVSACMFTAGVLVGRGNAPVEFDIQALQNEIRALKAKEKQTEIARHKIEPGFYEALKKPVETIPLPAAKPPAKKPPKAPAVGKKVVAKPATADKASRQKAEQTLREPGGSDKPLTIQVSSLKDHALARLTEKELKAKGYNAYVITAMVPGKGVWHRVRLGAFADKKEAQPVLKKLKSEGRKPILVVK